MVVDISPKSISIDEFLNHIELQVDSIINEAEYEFLLLKYNRLLEQEASDNTNAKESKASILKRLWIKIITVLNDILKRFINNIQNLFNKVQYKVLNKNIDELFLYLGKFQKEKVEEIVQTYIDEYKPVWYTKKPFYEISLNNPKNGETSKKSVKDYLDSFNVGMKNSKAIADVLHNGSNIKPARLIQEAKKERDATLKDLHDISISNKNNSVSTSDSEWNTYKIFCHNIINHYTACCQAEILNTHTVIKISSRLLKIVKDVYKDIKKGD